MTFLYSIQPTSAFRICGIHDDFFYLFFFSVFLFLFFHFISYLYFIFCHFALSHHQFYTRFIRQFDFPHKMYAILLSLFCMCFLFLLFPGLEPKTPYSLPVLNQMKSIKLYNRKKKLYSFLFFVHCFVWFLVLRQDIFLLILILEVVVLILSVGNLFCSFGILEKRKNNSFSLQFN